MYESKYPWGLTGAQWGQWLALQPLVPGPTRDRELGVREEPLRVFWPSSTTDVLRSYRKGSKGQASLLGHTWSRSPWAGGSWGRFLSPDWQFLWSQGSFRRSPLPGEIVWPETIISPSKADLPVCPLRLFSLTCDRLHHVQQENVKGRTANKFIATASCSGINLFHEWLLSIHCRQSPRRWSGLSACGRLLLA